MSRVAQEARSEDLLLDAELLQEWLDSRMERLAPARRLHQTRAFGLSAANCSILGQGQFLQYRRANRGLPGLRQLHLRCGLRHSGSGDDGIQHNEGIRLVL
jgi:hypothetical protein